MKRMILAAILLCTPAMAFEMPENLTQGMLVYGRVEPDETVHYGEYTAPVQDGMFLIALGRNTPKKIELEIHKGGFLGFGETVERKTFAVTPFDWQIDYVEGVPAKTVFSSNEDKKRINKEHKILDSARAKRWRSGFPMCFEWPIKKEERKRISSPFGWQRVYNGTPLRHHSGLDIAAATGTPVYATADGYVILAHDDLFYTGGTVLIEHGSGVQSGSSHLSQVLVKTGDEVKKGDLIGLVGMTGRATGPHLHFTLSWESIRIDPERILQETCP